MLDRPETEAVMDKLVWRRDRAGDALWSGETFLGCIYDRDGLASRARNHGWRVLKGEDMIVVGDVLPTLERPDARLGARALLEAEIGFFAPLPTAEELLRM
ncbi:hypothetical protein QFZ75_008054 [Streptomyces sp. V3I8]|uniref:hypothetical protein n=1 Tax=Streptomyces sp. V3I8 TaxID=3042279 RepID=UPI00277E0E13|nr:hypothetical protein [Streptomyces sp. V3I8]MDQ1041552.1 hypothetical protein [Streptomyces sp. V3I8]